MPREEEEMRAPVSELLVQPGEGKTWRIGGGPLSVKVASAVVGGAYTVLEFHLPPGGGAPLHVHTREDEILYVLGGALTVGAREQVLRAEMGATVWLPKGEAHFFRNEGEATCRLLITAVPGGLDEYFAETAEALESGQPERIAEINARYGIDFAPQG